MDGHMKVEYFASTNFHLLSQMKGNLTIEFGFFKS